jgi:predicted small secreted protein
MKKTQFIILALMLIAASLAQAENRTATGVGNIQSVFILPTSPKDGRDPFYPESTRTLDSTPATVHTVEISSLRVPGISGTPGHLLAIINNHTFAVGDEGEVLTATGRVNLRCLEIQPNFVLVEVNGQVHRISLDSQ